jgi:hypothetical protein
MLDIVLDYAGDHRRTPWFMEKLRLVSPFHFTVDVSPWYRSAITSQNSKFTPRWHSLSISVWWLTTGVRQGDVLSTHLYKQYLNELLNDLENHNIGISIGNTYAGCPTCADDTLSIRAAIFGESPSVNPNCMFDWPSLAIVVFSSSIYSKTLPWTDVKIWSSGT